MIGCKRQGFYGLVATIKAEGDVMSVGMLVWSGVGGVLLITVLFYIYSKIE